jgi:16S rRNA (uracil1498-N3)-methyltransferase
VDVDDLIYLLDENASDDRFSIKGENFKYLVKVLRHSVGDKLYFRNKDSIEYLYLYEVVSIEPRAISFELISTKKEEIKPQKHLHIGWCVIDSKSIEKVLASLNEIGVSDISFIYCDRSQKNFKLDFKRFERILESSSQQCGRTSKINFSVYKNLEEFLKVYPDTKVFDFTDAILKDGCSFKDVLIGCEGGFSKSERELLSTQEVFRLNTPMVLRSESAAMAVASKILL